METNLQKWSEKELISISSQREEALWEIVYGIDKFYLTNEEKEFLLDAFNKGHKYVDIKGNILTDKFLYITLDDEKYRYLKNKSIENIEYNRFGFIVTPLEKKYGEEIKEETEEQRKAREKARNYLKEKGLIK